MSDAESSASRLSCAREVVAKKAQELLERGLVGGDPLDPGYLKAVGMTEDEAVNLILEIWDEEFKSE